MDLLAGLSQLPHARRWRQQDHPVASVLALIRRAEPGSTDDSQPRYLLIRRIKEPYTGKWALVGGRWEFGERLDEAIVREVQEETGLDTRFVALRGLVSERIAPHGPEQDGAHFLLFVCEVAAPDGEAREQAEGPVAWYSLGELGALGERGEIVATDYAILQRFGGAAVALPYVEAAVVADSAQGADELLDFATML